MAYFSTIAFYFLWVALMVYAVIHLLLNKREPISTLSWLFFVLLVPVIGPLLYFVFGPERLIKQATLRSQSIEAESARVTFEESLLENPEHKLSPLSALCKKLSRYSSTQQNGVSVLSNPEDIFSSMELAIRNAKQYIHLEYYIISSDTTTERVFDALIDARKRGVQVRILYDSLGSLNLKRFHFRKLVGAGIKIAGFLPLSLVPQRLNLNFRNHRKILIVDGEIAFTGGTNLAKEYFGLGLGAYWRDFLVRLEGPVVAQLQDVFRRDWHFTTQEDLPSISVTLPHPESNDALIQVIDSGPDTQFSSLHQIVFYLITSSAREIKIITPYFIPDSAMTTALSVAARRGISVQILLPEKNDAPLVQMASRSFYDELLDAGVEIFEFHPKISHSKLLTIDNEWTLVGSANMDIRSFRLNYEITLLIKSKNLTEQTNLIFKEDLNFSSQILTDSFAKRSTSKKLVENICRLLSPVL